jgi:glycosyltransferase involved in cell wall biosynthesis
MNFRRFKFDPFNLALPRALRSADIIHYHQTHTMMASLALVYAHLSGKPIFTSHLGGSGYGLHRIANLDRYYDEHLHISEFSKRTFAQQGRAHASVILGGVDTEKFKPNGSPERTEVLYVGRLLPHKGINYLVEAVDETTPLSLVGRPWRHAQSFYELLQTLAVGKAVTFHTDYTDDETISAYQRAMCVVLPSVHETVTGEHYAIPELLGQTLLEGMACGAPAICTRVCSLPEVVEDGVSGFIVPPNDSRALGERIRWLTEHPADARRMGEAARRRVLEHFSWSSVVRRCFDAYGISNQNPA